MHGTAFSIVLYPSDEFGQQELSDADIPGFVSKYLPLGSDVHLMAKVSVNGERTDAVWRWLKTFYPGDVEWNFDALFLVDQAGQPVGRYTARELRRVEADLTYLLEEA
mmetsp:Transcript_36994/g.97960  ORF Transcript_36994/g.97960 Transcript_36994/m.97960 type:complete len:108 (+) Transcript_36994:277-600(+)|eukprot:CAMPEP_0115866314 /NCGR_PEP_ID=MMETSP0287-20121206/20184_1 /TAXON_ID=412157 /ORGANISM="Chrysochromulina rotalis, Strain UIO044" /LENGTH=107 /DNA_ID=CAMNT_0003320875 /DNA_START=204 /DNA_END=527 /DNA_ORIENTATION=+